MRHPAWFLVPVGFWCLLHLYLALRFIRPSTLRGWARAAAWVLLVASTVLPVVAIVLPRVGISLAPLSLLGFWFMGVTSALVMFAIAAEVTFRLPLGIATLAGVKSLRDPDRRRFFGNVVNASLAGAAGAIGVAGFVRTRMRPNVVEVDVPLEGLPASLDGFRIVQLSDVHVGPTIQRDDVAAIVEQANALAPDLVAVTGDLVDGFVQDLESEVAPLGRLAAPHGVFFVTGNHEYYWDAPAWISHLRGLGWRVLLNEHVVLERDGGRLLLAGVTDYHAADVLPEHATSPQAARAGAPEHDVSVLLAHQPSSIFEAATAGYDLQLSGHTHGGQYVPMNAVVHLVQPYVAGLSRHDRSWIYVSRGTGYWGPPLRVGAPHEITVVRLRRTVA